MSIIHFTKYQGTGNDFIVIDNFRGQIDNFSTQEIKVLCNRRLGIGADGVIIIEKSKSSDFYMNYFNSDGSKSFCGNGSRCAVHFANRLGLISNETKFEAIDGVHFASIHEKNISIQMLSVSNIENRKNTFVLNTGSPHFVKTSEDISSEYIREFGKSIRYSEEFSKEGINVNLMNILGENIIEIATYERGVEDETLSCGTGATACAIILNELTPTNGSRTVMVNVKGGQLTINYTCSEGKYTNIFLTGPAIPVFNGTIEI
jgi:diaminopimelate epimerase